MPLSLHTCMTCEETFYYEDLLFLLTVSLRYTKVALYFAAGISCVRLCDRHVAFSVYLGNRGS